eukprot:Gb_41022 [translate_table: standard]
MQMLERESQRIVANGNIMDLTIIQLVQWKYLENWEAKAILRTSDHTFSSNLQVHKVRQHVTKHKFKSPIVGKIAWGDTCDHQLKQSVLRQNKPSTLLCIGAWEYLIDGEVKRSWLHKNAKHGSLQHEPYGLLRPSMLERDLAQGVQAWALPSEREPICLCLNNGFSNTLMGKYMLPTSNTPYHSAYCRNLFPWICFANILHAVLWTPGQAAAMGDAIYSGSALRESKKFPYSYRTTANAPTGANLHYPKGVILKENVAIYSHEMQCIEAVTA